MARAESPHALQGRVFIDRDPRHFGLILNFLRDGACVLPADARGRRELLQEADFYQARSLCLPSLCV